MSQPDSQPKVRVVKSIANSGDSHASMPLDRRESVLQMLARIETQAGRLKKTVQELRAELTTK